MKLTQLLERLEYEVVQGDDQIEVTELINDSRKVSEVLYGRRIYFQFRWCSDCKPGQCNYS